MKRILIVISCCILFLIKGFSQATNIDFESSVPGSYTTSNAVNGWTISSQTATDNCNANTIWAPGSSEFSVVSTPIVNFPIIGTIGQSPLGGSNVVRLNNSTANSFSTKLSQTFLVTSNTPLLQCAWAGVFGCALNHLCCEQASLVVRIKNNLGVIQPCLGADMIPGVGCQSSGITFSVNSPGFEYWNNWYVRSIDLTPFIGTSITVEISVNDCAFGDHYGTAFFDSRLTSTFINLPSAPNCTLSFNPDPVNHCPGSSNAIITAPQGYSSYQWYSSGSPILLGTSQILTISNAIPGAVYTVNLVSNSGCLFFATYTVTNSQVGIPLIGSDPSCTQIANGSASVTASGSGTGYTYSWLDSGNSVISTNSVAGNLAPGIYTVNVSAAGSASTTCGLASATISINTITLNPIINSIPDFCSLSPIYTITANPPGGSFAGNSPGITVNGIITPSFAIIGTNTVTYTPPQNICPFSPITTTFIVNTNPALTPTGNNLICSGQTTTLSLPPGNLTYSWSTGSNSTSIVLSPNVTSTYTLLETNPATSCSTTLIFTITVVQNPTLVLSGNTSLCHGGSTSLTVSGANSYTWSNNSTNASLVLAPTTSSTYTVTGSNSPTCSAQSLTFGLTVLPTPTLTISGNATICEGESVLLNGNGASTYSWNNGMQTQTFSASPVATTAYTLYGTNSANCSSAKTITVTVSDCTGIKSTYKSSVNIYPNPTSEKLFIETPYSVKLSLSDAMGRILLSTEVQPAGTYLDLKDYPDGIYFLNLITGSSTEIIKVVKTK